MLKLKEEGEPEDHPLRRMWISVFVIIFCLGIIGAVFTFAEIYAIDMRPPPRDPPHIVFVLVDDLGWNDVSFHGSAQIPTPNIDALAAGGIILNNYYTHPQCTPSRGALLSGKYANRLGLYKGDLKPMEPSGLPTDVKILPQHLKDLGYTTHMVGKWHLGYHTSDYLPTRRGFDFYFGNLNGHLDYYDYTVLSEAAPEQSTNEMPSVFGVDLWENEKLLETHSYRGIYVTSLYTDKSIDIISEHNTTDPLFLFVSLTGCHLANSYMPFQAPPYLVARNKHISDLNRRKYAGMVLAVDDAIGHIFDALNGRKMLSNTIFVVSTDNGGLTSAGGGASSNYPLRGMKTSLWEGGVRATALIWSPLLGPEMPRTSNQLMHITDWLPTLYSVAGGNTNNLEDIDGIDMWPSLVEKNLPSPRQEVLLHYDPLNHVGSLRQGDMKLLFGYGPMEEDEWYGPSGEDVIVESIDSWVWKKDCLVKTILMDNDWWYLKENDTWRQDAIVTCGINFLPETGRCDVERGPCLYNITQDPCEFRNLAALHYEMVESMLTRVSELNNSSITEINKELDPRGDPRCSNFAFTPWLDGSKDTTECPWI